MTGQLLIYHGVWYFWHIMQEKDSALRQPLPGLSACDHSDIETHTARVRLASIVRRWTEARPRLHGLLLEFRSFLCRIRIVCKKSHTGEVELGPSFERSTHGGLQRCSGTLSRRKGIENMLASRPWATPLDWEIFLEGWDKGCELRHGTVESCNASNTGPQVHSS